MVPLIAIPVRSTEIKSIFSYYTNESYLGALNQSGCQTILIPPCESLSYYQQIAGICDGLLLTGGKDIDSVLYHEQMHSSTTTDSPNIDSLDFYLINAFSNKKKPILGICRGAQAINVCFGGTLYQDLPEQPSFFCQHKQTELRTQGVHNITWQLDTPGLYDKNTVFRVNSLHHQGFSKIAPGFQTAGICEDGLIEAIIKDNILAIQWHPEEMRSDCLQQRIFHYAFFQNTCSH